MAPARKPMADVTSVRGNDKSRGVAQKIIRKPKKPDSVLRPMKNSVHDNAVRDEASRRRDEMRAIAQAQRLADTAGLGEAADDMSASATLTAVTPLEAAAAPPSLGNTGKPTNNKRKNRSSDEQYDEVAPKKLKSRASIDDEVDSRKGKSRSPRKGSFVAKKRAAKDKTARRSGGVEISKVVKNEHSAARKPSAPKKRKAVEALEEHYAQTIVDEPAKKMTKRSDSTLRGLVNYRDACFSNSIIQFLDAALAGEDLAQLLGSIDHTEFPGVSEGDLDIIAASSSTTTRGATVRRERLVEAIRNAGVEANTSVKKQLRKVLEDLRDGSSSKPVKPILLQMVMAYEAAGATESEAEVAAREAMSGVSHQDAFEYYQSLLNKLCDKPSTKDGQNGQNGQNDHDLKSLLDITSITTPTPAQKVASRTIRPRSLGLQARIDESLVGATDKKCERCGVGNMEWQTHVTAQPQLLVLKVDRVGYNKDTKQAVKHKSPVVMPVDGKVCFGAQQYEVDAVVMHKGPNSKDGHYTVVRKHGKCWHWLDDRESRVVHRNSANGIPAAGESAMILLKRV
ncbi:hypothetical protein LTR56_000325 [Elasticomyces elasticus]|nr:hypothetical protein LTR56_000325 [Elasticomyces elasticus]KAK3666979.1 hypothetical protein LTR22_002204 [Elasticomyces elasticus]KAK4933317.1 hypothetical protein LTR49_000311 [Elasticomyces elasticus]KAK5757329.1 hypothetical protein LTS12_012541 [Elasticomyces elasticus]